MATVPENTITGADLDPITRQALEAFRRRRGTLLLLRAAGVALLVFFTLTTLLAVVDFLFLIPDALRWCLSIGIYVAVGVSAWRAGIAPRRERDPLSLARHVESAAPLLREDLFSAVELADPRSSNGSPAFRKILQTRVARRISKLDFDDLLPLQLVRRWLLSGGALAALCLALMLIPSAQFGRRFARAALPGVAIERASRTRVRIIVPAPASGYVAERDAVGVIADISGAAPEEASLQWRSVDGATGYTPMTPRMDNNLPATTTDSDDQDAAQTKIAGQLFAANLSVGSVPVEYRILAGDAITLWHKLKPLPRPHVTRYQKTYHFPEYAKLQDRTEDDEHGDLKALQGSTADVTVTFDQPVESAVVRFGVRGTRMQMEPVDDSGRHFRARISVKTSGQYQVDAVSVESGLNNPFSPSNVIAPILDTPPMIRWSDEIPDSQLVSSLDVLELQATAVDDLPLDRIVHQFQINGGEFQSVNVTPDHADRKLELDWKWDLLDRRGDGPEADAADDVKLTDGDLIRTRVVAIDRLGAQSESRLIELLVAGDGFDASRNDFLKPMAQRAEALIQWASDAQTVADSLQDACEQNQLDQIAPLQEDWRELQRQSVELMRSIQNALTETQNAGNGWLTERLGRAVLDVETRISGQLALAQTLKSAKDPDWKKQFDRHRQELQRDTKSTGFQCERLREFARAQFSLAFTAALHADVSALRSSVDRLVEDFPDQRLPRHLTLLQGRFAEIDRMIDRYTPILSDRTVQHLTGESWFRWSQRWAIQIETLLEDNPSKDQAFAVIESLHDQVRDKPQHVIDASVHESLLRWGRDLQREMGSLADLTRQTREAGEALRKSTDDEQKDRSTQAAVQAALESKWCQAVWDARLNRLLVRAAGQENLNRDKAKVDLNYAADQHLFRKAVKNVSSDGYRDYKDESAGAAFNAIADAIAVLQAAGDLSSLQSTLADLSEGERQPDRSPLRKVFHPSWLALTGPSIEWSVRSLRPAGQAFQDVVNQVDQARYSEAYQSATRRIDPRRWELDEMVSAEKPLESVARDLQDGLESLEPAREAARQTLRRYILMLSEQARQAAEAARNAEQITDRRDDSEQPAEDQSPAEPKRDQQEQTASMREAQDQAVEKATETIQSLIDRANTAEITDGQEREIARDADAAAELIAQAVRETKQQLARSETAATAEQRDQAGEASEQELRELAERLEQTAEHFEKIENGEDVTTSREQLRRDEQALQQDPGLEQRYESAEAMAEAAKQNPRELLRQLEEELKRNPPMQEALSEISERTVREAAKTLRQAAEEEESLQQQLESEDDGFAEQKRQQRLMLSEFSTRMRTLRDRTLGTASHAASWANEPQLREQIEQAQQQVTQAIEQADQTNSDSATLDELQNAIDQMRQSVRQAADTATDIADQMKKKTEQDLHGDSRKREATARRVQGMANQLRNEELKSLDQQRKQWSSAETDAGRRIKSAEQNQRQADASLQRAQDQLKNNPDNESLQREVDRQQDRRNEAERSSQQARRTKDLARERRDLATERANNINKSKANPFEKPNPAAELAEQSARDAAERMRRLSDELEKLQSGSEIASELRATTDSAERLSRQQNQVESDVRDVGEDLSRASRHEQRLSKPQTAEELRQAAEQTEQQARQPAQRAGEELAQAAQEASNASQAGAALREAADKIAEQAEAIDQLAGPAPETSPSSAPSADPGQNPSQPSGSQSSPSGSQPSGSQPSGTVSAGSQPSETPNAAPSRARQMAQTLDELDRSLAAQGQQGAGDSETPSQPGQGQSGAQGQPSQGQPSPGQSGQGQPGQGQPGQGQPGQSQSGSQPSTSGQGSAAAGSESSAQDSTALDASPTLAEMLDAQMQRAARERMQMLQQAQAGQQAASSQASSSAAASESGQGSPPAGSDDVDLIDGQAGRGDWGQLRERGVDDAAQGRGSQIPRGYAKEVQAYFKALSKRSAEGKP
ncbi:hypothetical protein FYK55_04830 [Roseiconus nitratireducens]|uniref:Uncharacterized protein n=1 Tax=Roseiconus nitratireducens TaxID=2605748 RepID=A0A5M6DFE5_9BACT|nr:hypothetical protein [Roseiconus nitratireducens]KAA5546218.1 hypothetical protein FYK55_04830 [Roseiconus nitratireducens]